MNKFICLLIRKLYEPIKTTALAYLQVFDGNKIVRNIRCGMEKKLTNTQNMLHEIESLERELEREGKMFVNDFLTFKEFL